MEYHAFNDSFTGLPGQAPTPAAPAAPSQPRYEVGRGGTEVTISNGQMTIRKDSDSANTFEASTGFAREADLLSTARSAQGSAVTGRALTASDTVDVMGQRMSLAVAERLGFAQRDAGGNWRATAQGDASATMPEGKKVETKLADGGTAEQAQAEGFMADEATEATLAEIVSTVSESTNMAMVNSYARSGEIDPKLIARAASQAGVAPEDMAAKYEAAVAGMEQAMDARLASLGVFDHDLFANYVQGSGERLAEAHKALFALATSNSTEGFDRLAEGFVESLDQIAANDVADALEDAGIPYRRVGGKTLIRFPDGAEVSYGVAVKRGLIKVGRA